jgi:hypothetical protein
MIKGIKTIKKFNYKYNDLNYDNILKFHQYIITNLLNEINNNLKFYFFDIKDVFDKKFIFNIFWNIFEMIDDIHNN